MLTLVALPTWLPIHNTQQILLSSPWPVVDVLHYVLMVVVLVVPSLFSRQVVNILLSTRKPATRLSTHTAT